MTKQVRVIKISRGATQACNVGDVYELLHFAQAGDEDFEGCTALYDSAAFIDAVGAVAVGWTSGPFADLELV